MSTEPQRIPSRPARLVVDRSIAAAKIQGQIEEGKDLSAQPALPSSAFFDRFDVWQGSNRDLLTDLFETDSVLQEFNQSTGAYLHGPGISFVEDNFRAYIYQVLRQLERILRRLDVMPSLAFGTGGGGVKPDSTPKTPAAAPGTGIFLVHGHDPEMKEAVARFLERMKLEVTVLQEQPDRGRTIIEKFEDYADVGYAVVLLTADDVGAASDKRDHLQPRARQNVILELGYFLGKLGRGRVAALCTPGVEIPSDLSGILYIGIDEAGGWKLELMKELKHSGIDVDVNLLFA